MIDTVKFKIECEPRILDKIREKSTEISSFDHGKQKMNFQVYRSNISVGSWKYCISIFLGEGCFYLEFSLPKYVYGNNVYLFDPSLIRETLGTVHRQICHAFNVKIPQVLFWILIRIDLCYAWKFYDDLTAQRVIEFLKTQQYKRKRTANYGTSTMFIGTESTLKFYMKGPEFYAHDWRRIKEVNIDEALLLLEGARGVVRFEITLRQRAICSLLGIPSDNIDAVNLFDKDTCVKILQKFLHVLLGVEESSMSLNNAFQKFMLFKPRRALQLYSFYRLYLSGDSTDKFALTSMPKSTLYRYKSIIKKLELGLPEEILEGRLNLKIPSEYSIGFFAVGSNTLRSSHV